MQTETRVASADDAYLDGISGAGDNRTIVGLDAASCTYESWGLSRDSALAPIHAEHVTVQCG
ncbi:hypothetical protein GGP56_002210 [Salinibacter ruber]|nr:hypothetical protein [Salinibacter ruber]